MPKQTNANYKAGYRAEREAFDTLKELGFLVIRSAKSGSPFDLVGISERHILLVQVKLCPFGKLANFDKVKDELRKIKVPPLVKKELWVKERRRGFHYFPLTDDDQKNNNKGEKEV